jgi:hypothetical protein
VSYQITDAISNNLLLSGEQTISTKYSLQQEVDMNTSAANFWFKFSAGGRNEEIQYALPHIDVQTPCSIFYLVDDHNKLAQGNGQVIVNGQNFPMTNGIAKIDGSRDGTFDATMSVSINGQQKDIRISNVVFSPIEDVLLPICVVAPPEPPPQPTLKFVTPSTIVAGQTARLEIHVTPTVDGGFANISYWDWDRSNFVTLGTSGLQGGVFALDWTPSHSGDYSFWATWRSDDGSTLGGRYEVTVRQTNEVPLTSTNFTARVEISSSTINLNQSDQFNITIITEPSSSNVEMIIEVSIDGQNWFPSVIGRTGSDGRLSIPWRPQGEGNFYIHAKWANGTTTAIPITATPEFPYVLLSLSLAGVFSIMMKRKQRISGSDRE